MRTRDQIQADANRAFGELGQKRTLFLAEEKRLAERLTALEVEMQSVLAEEQNNEPAALAARVAKLEAAAKEKATS